MVNRFVVAHRPYERLKLRVGINTGPVIAGVQVKVHIIKIIVVKNRFTNNILESGIMQKSNKFRLLEARCQDTGYLVIQ